jgi:N-acyl homoserine lactone hydrolase
MAARDPWRSGSMRLRHPITRVSWSAPGTVSIHPDMWHRPGSGLPVAAHSQHWTKLLPISAYVIEHRDGIVLFDPARTGRRSPTRATSPAAPPESPTTASRTSTSAPTIRSPPGWRPSATTSPRTNCCAVPSPPGPHRRAAGVPRCRRRDPGQPPGVAVPTATAAGASRAAALPHPAPWAALAPHRACANRRSRPGPVHRRPSPVRRRSLALLPTPGHTPGSLSMLVRRPDRPPLLMVDDLTYDAHLLEHGHLPGVGSRRQLHTTTAMTNVLRRRHPDLVILPAHDPGPPAAGNGDRRAARHRHSHCKGNRPLPPSPFPLLSG